MTLRVSTANADFLRNYDGKYIRHLAESNDVLLLQEMKNVNLRRKVPKGWKAIQFTATRATMGSAIAVNTETVEVESAWIVPIAYPRLGKKRFRMLTRWACVAILRERASGRTAMFVSAHIPPKRFRVLQPGAVKRLRALVNKHPNLVLGVDANMSIRELGRRLGLRSYGQGIIGVLTDRDVENVQVNMWGMEKGYTDHPSVKVVVKMQA